MPIVDVFETRTFYSYNLTSDVFLGDRKKKLSAFSMRLAVFNSKSGKEGHLFQTNTSFLVTQLWYLQKT